MTIPPWNEAVNLLEKIVSGGQTGSDRAALDWAIAHGIPHGGWCPAGRLAADGALDARYQLQETESAGYRQRTRRNVADSDGTLIVNRGELTGGTLLTQEFARKLGKPCHVVEAGEAPSAERCAAVLQWMTTHAIRQLNVAGPRESKQPGIYLETLNILESIRDFISIHKTPDKRALPGE
jgi:hypothetical protein